MAGFNELSYEGLLAENTELRMRIRQEVAQERVRVAAVAASWVAANWPDYGSGKKAMELRKRLILEPAPE